jgi:CubicO group peptidase (beta-lactamase class C family)
MKIRTLFAITFAIALQAAHGQVDNPHSSEPIATVREVYDGTFLPDIGANTFRNIDRLFSTRIVENGSHVYPLPTRDNSITTLSIESNGEHYDLYDYLSLNRVSGLLAIKDGEVAYETYQLGNTDKTRWMSMSIAKSITATLIGAAIKDGYIASLDSQLVDYIPALAGSAYDGVTVQQVLQMTSGAGWNETYTDRTSDRRELLEAQIAQEEGGMLEVMANLQRVATPGSRWNYSTGETQVAAELLSAAINRPISEYLTEKIWANMGMESQANWWLESPGGIEVGGSGFSATLRDYGRFGQFLLDEGIVDGEPVLPDGWVERSSRPNIINGEEVEYGFMLWPEMNAQGTIHEEAFEAVGIFGQFIYVNPRENVVIVVWSARSKPGGSTVVAEADFFAAMTEALR